MGKLARSPLFLPNNIEKYTVNRYSYTLYNYMDTCYEILLDIKVSEDEFDSLFVSTRSYSDYYVEQPFEYADCYLEIAFIDFYEPYEDDGYGKNVGWADIEKAIYNPDTYNIAYVVFHANDTGVYAVNDVSYFKRFSIIEDEYLYGTEK